MQEAENKILKSQSENLNREASDLIKEQSVVKKECEEKSKQLKDQETNFSKISSQLKVLENEKHVLSRSKRLTKPRRKSLIILILPYVLMGQAVQLAEFVYSAEQGKLILINSVYEGFLILILSSFYMIYHERVTLISERKAKKKEQGQQDVVAR